MEASSGDLVGKKGDPTVIYRVGGKKWEQFQGFPKELTGVQVGPGHIG